MNKHLLRTKQKKHSILRATINLVATKPIEHITVDNIKHAAKVSQVTLYKIFDTKANLINIAIKELSLESVNAVMRALTSDLQAKERFQAYFRASFTIALSYPRQKDLIEYIFSGIDLDLKNHVLSLYEKTYPQLERLYNDIKKANLIREEISLQKFFSMCDMFTRIQPVFFSTTEDMEILIRSIVHSFN